MAASELFFGFEWHTFRFADEQHPLLAAMLSVLEEQGFARLGVKWEAPPGFEKMHSLELASPKHQCFASCAVFNGRPSMHLLTTFTDGTVVVTWFGSLNEELRTRRFVHRNVPRASPLELLAVHAAEVARQKKRGKEPFEDWTAQGRLEASALYYANPDNPLSRWDLRRRAFWLQAACDAALAACWLLALFWPVSAALKFGLVANASATMALSHWYGARGSARKLAWVATLAAAASTAAAWWAFLR